MKPRLAAARVIAEVLRERGSLSSQLPPMLDKVAPADRALVQNLCYGTLRWQPRLAAWLSLLVDKPLRPKDSDITALLLLGLYQLEYTRIPDHAAIGETAGAARALKKAWATGLINGVLRRFQREKDDLSAQLRDNPEYTSAHPLWLLDALGQAWPEHRDALVAANNAHPPFTLRLDTRQCSREDYLKRLAENGHSAHATPFSDSGITLEEASDPLALPGFSEGWVSVQDEAAQLAAPLLGLAPGQRVLDACAAPGGKTGHILQSQPGVSLTALDSDARRLNKVRDTLVRLGVTAELIHADAAATDQWWDGKPFDRILLDAPCSASGIIRRHSDIKLLRSPAAITRLANLQAQLLDALWPLLAADGILLYATCSVLPAENSQVAEAFLARTPDAKHLPIEAPWGLAQAAGRQLLPQNGGHDGFYYCKLQKIAKCSASA